MSDDDLVPLFGQMVTRDWAEALMAEQSDTVVRDADGSYVRIPYGAETFRTPIESRDGPCRHCFTIHGKLHSFDCDYEQCPKCNHQLMTCDCEFISHEWREEECTGRLTWFLRKGLRHTLALWQPALALVQFS